VKNQRWEHGKSRFRPNHPIRTAEYDVAYIPDDRTAKAFILQHHYSKSFPPRRRRYGLYRFGNLVGVAVFSQVLQSVASNSFGSRILKTQVMELTRFVLLDEVPGNGETWFLGRCFELIKPEGFLGIISFSDPQPRYNWKGECIFPGHYGCIYQAHNGVYTGRSEEDVFDLYPDGMLQHPRGYVKLRKLEKGWSTVVDRLVSFGATPLTDWSDRAERCAWLDTWRAKLTRPMAHPGNHRYLWRLNRRVRLPVGRERPTTPEPQLAPHAVVRYATDWMRQLRRSA